jgi:hypothetical protein
VVGDGLAGNAPDDLDVGDDAHGVGASRDTRRRLDLGNDRSDLRGVDAGVDMDVVAFEGRRRRRRQASPPAARGLELGPASPFPGSPAGSCESRDVAVPASRRVCLWSDAYPSPVDGPPFF